MDARDHWERIYQAKSPTELSWYQPEARLSLELIRRVAPDRSTPIIDVGGGASTLVDALLDAGYEAVTVLDVAPGSLAIAGKRLGERASKVRWMVADALDAPLHDAAYGVWHDRAVFHFLTDSVHRERYVAQARRAVRPGGHVIVASFSLEGPPVCSGLDVVRYSPQSLRDELGTGFRLLDSLREDHATPGGVVQSFVYCLCRVESGRAPP